MLSPVLNLGNIDYKFVGMFWIFYGKSLSPILKSLQMDNQSENKFDLEKNDEEFDNSRLGDVDNDISEEIMLFLNDPEPGSEIFQNRSSVQDIFLIKSKQPTSRAYKTSTNYKILRQSILKDYEGDGKSLTKKLTSQNKISEKSYIIIFLLLLYVYSEKKTSKENCQKLIQNIHDAWKDYANTSEQPKDFLKFLRIQIQRLENAISLYFEGSHEKAIHTCYEATQQKKKNKGNSKNHRERCLQIFYKHQQKFQFKP